MNGSFLCRSMLIMWSVWLVVGLSLVSSLVWSAVATPFSVSCRHAEQCFESVVEWVQEGGSLVSSGDTEWKTLLRQMEKVDERGVWTKRAKLHVGYSLKQTWPEAARGLLWVSLKDFPVLSDYIRLWIGQTYFATERWKEAVEVLEEVLSGTDESRIRIQALYLAGEALGRSGNCLEGEPILSRALSEDSSNVKAPWSVAQLGDCALQRGDRPAASGLFRRLWKEYPLSPEARKAGAWFSQTANKAFILNHDDAYQRAVTLYEKRAYPQAVEAFEQLLTSKARIADVHEIRYRLAKSLIRLKRYDQAHAILSVLAESISSRSDDAWVLLGKVHLRQGNGKSLQELISEISQKNLSQDQQARLLTYYGIWLGDQGQWGEMKAAYRQSVKRAHSHSMRVSTLWRLGWSLYQQKDFQEALEHFEELLRISQPLTSHSSVETYAKAVYWIGRIQDQLGHHKKARGSFERLQKSYPYTYYGILAGNRLGGIKPVLPAMIPVSSDRKGPVRPDLTHMNHYRKSLELATLRIRKEAREELGYLYRSHGSDATFYIPLVSLAQKVGAYDVGIRLAIRHHGKSLQKGGLPLSSDIWASAYPLGYRNVVQAWVPKHVDPYLVWGLIREESLYREQAKSSVGAMGLMQLMPYTAKRVGEELGVEEPNDLGGGLLDPEYNIRLGAHYLGHLLEKFQDNIAFSVAAYNAGPPAVEKWIVRHGKRPTDEFVESIGYRETRRYVKRVIRSYRIYRMLSVPTCPHPSLDRFC